MSDFLNMNGWMIAIIVVIVVIVVIVLLILCVRHIKKKLKNKIIDTGADIIKKTSGNILNEEGAGVVNEAVDVTAQILKGGNKIELIKAAAKKGFETAKDNEKDKKKSSTGVAG